MLKLWSKGPPNWGCDGKSVAKLCGLPASSHEDPAAMKDSILFMEIIARERNLTLKLLRFVLFVLSLSHIMSINMQSDKNLNKITDSDIY